MKKETMSVGTYAAREENIRKAEKAISKADAELTAAIESGDEVKIKDAAQKAFGTHQWADQTINILKGCECGCIYCFAAARAYRFHEKEPGQWTIEILNENQFNKKVSNKACLTMFPSTHNISPNAHLPECEQKIQEILNTGSQILIVLKPWKSVVEDICTKFEAYKEQIIFRFTIGSADNATLKFWEPGAPSYDERLDALRYAFEHGFSTSISCEPFLDNNIDQVIADTRAFITDSIWVGTMNQGRARIKVNGHWTPEVEAKYNELMGWYSEENIRTLYERYKDDSLIRWKESIAKVVGAKSDCATD